MDGDGARPSKLSRTSDAGSVALITVPSDAPAQRRSALSAPSMLLEKAHTHLVTGLAFSPDGRTLATSSKDKTICASSRRRRAPARSSFLPRPAT